MLGFTSGITLLFYITTEIYFSSGTPAPPSTCTDATEFACNDGTCIRKTKRCDGNNDCPDSSDEWECELFHCLEPNWFRCKNKICISRSFVCDYEDDCGDRSDEQNCESILESTITASSNCSSTEWRCADRLCIPKEWVCNGEPDCLDGSDETDECKIKNCDGFRCKNGQCILKEWRCDQSRDCKDGSDEDDCEIKPGCDLREELFHCADNKSCIKLSQKCDGIAQCADDSDETDSCLAVKGTCKELGCSHRCVELRYGSRCVCPDGYRVQNMTNCTDINECTIYGICDQKCRNTPGSYNCFCEQNYELQEDGRTCKVDKNNEALMVFSAKNQIRGYLLHSQVYFPMVKRVKQAIGVAYDKHYLYWTEIFGGNESIVRASQNGTRIQAVVTSGLGTPEDLAIDWITGNIYFTDTEIQHIGVCTNDGMYCTVLVKRSVDKPRSIVLNPLDGEMYWSDWGKRPEIARASMDGTDDISFVANNIAWPNGLALDRPNRRLYWTDAKLRTIESIKLDGTDRRIIFQGIVQHPYGLAVFEDRIYWSDWTTRSIESCNKFTGKDHHILLKQSREIYGIHIFHTALQTFSRNPCEFTFCSDICLLNKQTYSCACPKDKILNVDKHTCRETFGKQRLVIGTKDSIWLLQYEELGKHNITKLPTTLHNMTAMVYNDLNNSLFISDASSKSLVEMKLPSGDVNYLPNENSFGCISAMAFDNLGNNLYWCDSEYSVLEVLNLNTMSRKVILGDIEGEIPIGLTLIPEESTMFVAFQTSTQSVHIDRFNMKGKDRRHVIEKRLLGPLRLLYDYELHRIFWADSNSGTIQSTSADGDDRHSFRSLNDFPTAIASLKNKILWANSKSQLYWATKLGNDDTNKKVSAELPENIKIIHLLSVTPTKAKPHPCKQNNGNCSHICLVNFGLAICKCPLGLKLGKDQKQCYKPFNCNLNEFFCQKSDMCIAKHMRCDKKHDCLFGEDEDHCEVTKVTKQCGDGYFQCKDGDCIRKNLVCNNYSNCKDNSDENNCGLPSNKTSCDPNDPSCMHKHCREGFCNGSSTSCDDSKEFRCKSGKCIPKQWECDEQSDCPDASDEHENCEYNTCKSTTFQCKNGLCIDKKLQCNKIDDCGDFSDESFCTKKVTECKADEFHCYNSNLKCLPSVVRCNGTSECPHHEDEQGCSNCHNDEFECGNKKCISRHKVCDRKDDCGDNSDEDISFCSHIQCRAKEFLCYNSNFQCVPISVRCNGSSECPHHEDEQGCSNCHVNEFECDNQKCIPRHWVCNHIDDCGDNSDEDKDLCSHQQCKDYEFQCSKSNFQCLSMLVRCNGTSECPHHEDEQGCSLCHVDEFECKNRKCIPRQWVCDYSDDCGDDSDESMDFCSHKPSFFLPSNDFACDKDFRCRNGKCIDIELVCNNLDDCGDNSDENSACLESCSINNNPCSQICKKTPSGPQCYCRSGYRLRGDGHTCADIKECSLEPPACSQVCTEQPGSFECSCYTGYMLRADGRSCKSTEDMSMSIIYATSSEIYQLFPKNNTLNMLYSDDKIKITGIDVSIGNGLVYFITENSRTLNRIHIHHYTYEYMNNVGKPQHLAVEWITQNVYLVDDSLASKSIHVCNFETQHCANIVNINVNNRITALSVDSVNKYIFYALSNWEMLNSPSILYKCRLDGSDLQLIYHSVNDFITGLTYDVHKQILYYSDHINERISKVQYDGANQMVILGNLTKPATPTVFDDHLYFYLSVGYISACPLFKDYQACKSYRFYGHFNEKYVIAHSSRQPVIRNFCENSSCPHFCIPKVDQAQCLCNSDTIHHDVNYCQLMQVTRISLKGFALQRKDKTQKGSSAALAVMLTIAVGATIASISIYYYCFRKKTGNITISMRFQNPIYGYIQDNSSQEIILQPGLHEYYNPLTAGTDDLQSAKELNKTLVF